MYDLILLPNICHVPLEGPSCSGSGVKASKCSLEDKNNRPLIDMLVEMLTSFSL